MIRSLDVPHGRFFTEPEGTPYDSWLETFAGDAVAFSRLRDLTIAGVSTSASLAMYSELLQHLPALRALKLGRVTGREDASIPPHVLDGVCDLTITHFECGITVLHSHARAVGHHVSFRDPLDTLLRARADYAGDSRFGTMATPSRARGGGHHTRSVPLPRSQSSAQPDPARHPDTTRAPISSGGLHFRSAELALARRACPGPCGSVEVDRRRPRWAVPSTRVAPLYVHSSPGRRRGAETPKSADRKALLEALGVSTGRKWGQARLDSTACFLQSGLRDYTQCLYGRHPPAGTPTRLQSRETRC